MTGLSPLAPGVARPKRQYLDGPFGQIHVRIASPPGGADAETRPPLCCLHQSPKSGLEFEAFMVAAARDRIVIAPDYPGYGMSDPPPNEAAATIDAYARAMWAAMEGLGHGRVSLLGHHTGSKVAVEMARARPQAVDAMVLISASLMTDEERARFADYFQPVPLDAAGTRFTGAWSRIREFSGPGMTLEAMARSLAQNIMGGEGYEWGHAAAFNWVAPFREALETPPCPIAIINPGDELQEITRRAAPFLPEGALIERPQWSHGFLEVHAGEAAALVRQLLDDPPRAGA